jgi:predicted O-methyltransferase YrrM
MLSLTPQSDIDVQPIDWLGLPRDYCQPGEMEILIAMARSVKPRRMLEIGVRDGRTAKLMLHHLPTLELYYGIDVPLTYQPQLTHQRNEMTDALGKFARGDRRFELIVREHGSLDLSKDDLLPCDVIYIDGDHGDRAVRHDSVLALDLIRSGGLIVWHDYHNGSTVDVKAVLDELAHAFPLKLIENTWFAYLEAARSV